MLEALPIVAALLGLVGVTVALAVWYLRSARRAAAELGPLRAAMASVGNVLVLLLILGLATVLSAVAATGVGRTAEAFGIPETGETVLVLAAIAAVVLSVTLGVAYGYDRLFPDVTRSFE